MNDDTTLGEAKQWLFEHIREGVECPACTQHVQIYKRPLTSEMADILIKMYRQSPSDWVYVPGLGPRGGDYAKMRYWELIEARPGVRDDGSTRVGWWRVTARGRRFVRNEEKVFKNAHVYAEMVYQRDGDEVSIIDALGKRFNYAALMRGDG